MLHSRLCGGGFVFVCLCVNRTISADIVTFLPVLPTAGDRHVIVYGVRCFQIARTKSKN